MRLIEFRLMVFRFMEFRFMELRFIEFRFIELRDILLPPIDRFMDLPLNERPPPPERFLAWPVSAPATNKVVAATTVAIKWSGDEVISDPADFGCLEEGAAVEGAALNFQAAGVGIRYRKVAKITVASE